MNVFEAVYYGNVNPVESSFIAAETAFDIAIMKAEREYAFESGLNSFSNNKLFMESPEVANAKTENGFVKVVKGICNAIRNFIGDIGEIIANLFSKNENITPEDFFESPTGKIKLSVDARQLDAAISDEIRKGNSLLQKVSSTTGISDEVIDNWVRTSAEHVNKLMPVIVPAVMAFGFKKLFSKGLKSMRSETDSAEREATKSSTDEKRNRQKMKILNNMQTLTKKYGEEAKKFTTELFKHKKKS